MSSISQGLIIGTRAIVARLMRTGDVRNANDVARQAFIISVAYGAITSAIGALLVSRY